MYAGNIFEVRNANKSDITEIIPISDVHFGNSSCDESAYERTIRYILSKPNRYTILGGDHIEGINPSDIRFNINSLHERYRIPTSFNNLCMAQADDFVEATEPLSSAGKIIGAHVGNHEEKVEQRYHFSVHKYICEALMVKDLTWTALTKIYINDKRKNVLCSVVLYSMHGAPGKNLSLWGKKMTEAWEADIYIMGHNHHCDVLTTHVNRLNKNTGLYESCPRVFGYTGTYLKQYEHGPSQYGEHAGYPPTHIGPICITIENATGRVSIRVLSEHELNNPDKELS